MEKLELYGIIIAVALLAAFGWGQHRHSQGVDEERGRWEVKAAAATKDDLKSLGEAVAAGTKIAQDTFDKVSKGKADRVIDRGVIEREIKTDVRYATDCFPDTGRLRWNDLLSGRRLLPIEPAVAQPATGLPATAGARDPGQQGRNDPAKPR